MRAGENEAAKTCLGAVRDRAARANGEGKRVWARAGAAIVEAVGEFARGNYSRAADVLDPVMPDMTMIGGSDAQGDLFRQTYLRALQRAGRAAAARAYFERICEGKGATPLDRKLAA